ncbi:MAG: penicillin-binding protein 2 [Alphaproteobacteria bacterium]|nr:penicillin-binding protein 2 [Alphaproteobacteria bacterium]
MRKYQRLSSHRPAQRVVRGESRSHKALEQSRLRLICVAVFFALSFAALGLRLLEVTLVGGGDLPFKRLVSEPQLLLQREEEIDISKAADTQHIVRREITDRNGYVLATSIKTASLVANPTIIRHESDVAMQLQRIFPDQSLQVLLDKLENKKRSFIYMRRHLTPAQQEAVNNLGIPGLFFETDTRRVYPYGGLFAHVLGYVDTDNKGIAGIEKFFDAKLQHPIEREPLVLSLDLRAQSILRDEMAQAVKTFSAIGATGVIADVKSGEIIAMANLPEFNPQYPNANPSATFNRASLGAYEMGSTFKTFTLAAALDKGTVDVTGGYDASHPIKVASFTINDSHPENRWLSVGEIFAHSSNIGMVKMALDLGTESQQEYLRKLGLLDPVSIELPERAKPLVPSDWRKINTMTISFGHGISVSPLHVVQAIASLVGDGTKRTLTLMKDGNKDKPQAERVVTAETSTKIRKLLRLVVEHGTGKSGDAPGYVVGGKTGTAEKNTGGAYNANAKLASFVAAFPANDPQYVILIMVDEPKGTKATYGYATGGWVAAPAVGRVVQRMAPLFGMAPDFTYDDAEIDGWWADAENRVQQINTRRMQKLQERAIHAATY